MGRLEHRWFLLDKDSFLQKETKITKLV